MILCNTVPVGRLEMSQNGAQFTVLFYSTLFTVLTLSFEWYMKAHKIGPKIHVSGIQVSFLNGDFALLWIWQMYLSVCQPFPLVKLLKGLLPITAGIPRKKPPCSMKGSTWMFQWHLPEGICQRINVQTTRFIKVNVQYLPQKAWHRLPTNHLGKCPYSLSHSLF